MIENPSPGYGGLRLHHGGPDPPEIGDAAERPSLSAAPARCTGSASRDPLPEVPAGRSAGSLRSAESISRSPGWPVEVREDDAFIVSVKAGKAPCEGREPLLVALERGGIVIPSLCRSGECSQCRLKQLAGRDYQPEGTPVRRSDRQHGYIHSCAAYPLEDLEILL